MIFGHSRGAAESLKLARDLKKEGVAVDLVLTIDPVLIDPVLGQAVPSNVRKATNFYETKSLSLMGTYITADSSETELDNQKVTGVGHADIDDWVAAHGGVDDIIEAVLEKRKATDEE